MKEASKVKSVLRQLNPLLMPLWGVYMAVGCVLSAVYFLAGTPVLHHIIYITIGASAALAVLVGARRSRPREMLPWYLLGAGQMAFVTADLTRAFYEGVLGVEEAPFPGLADVFFLSGYPLLAAGLAYVIRSRDPSREHASLIDALIISVSLGVVFWVFLMDPYANDPALGGLEKLISVGYPLLDVLLIAVAARLAIGPGVRRPAYYMLGGSLLTLLIADVIYAVALLSESYHTGYPGDAFWLLSYLLFGAAALHPSMSALTEPEREQEVKFTRRRLALLAAASLTTPAVRAIQAFRGQETEVYITVGGSVVLFLLVLMRLAGLVRQLSRTLERTRRAEADRRRTEERFTSLVQNSSDVVTVTDGEGHISYISPAVEGMLGYEPRELEGQALATLLHEDDRARLFTVYREMVQHAAAQPTRLEYRWRHRDGSFRDVEVTFSNLLRDASVRGIVLNTRDVSERKALEAQLAHQAFHDPLTNLANRVLFRERVEHALRRRHGRPLSVLFLDIDDFKTVNDSLGHTAGDQLLLAVADRLRVCLREGDTAARLGGDEFGVLLEEASQATPVSERVREALREPISIADNDVCVTASIGISVSTLAHDGADELLRNADVAMYTAKNRGKDRYEMFEPDMHVTALRRLELEAELRRAIERSEFRVHYQPIVELESGRVAGLEALVRWAHPERGLLGPGEFIALAEHTGLIMPLGRWVLEQACEQAKAWQDERSEDDQLTMSVNLSADQLTAPGLIDEVTDALAKSGLAPNSLMIEITESVLMRDADTAIARLKALRTLGVRVSIDDFGTGFSSLSYLQRFPVDVVKIAKPFVDDMDRGNGAALVRGIVELARTLELAVVAEGVELETQAELLREMRCGLAQGYYFARPQNPQRVRQLLRSAAASQPRREPLGHAPELAPLVTPTLGET